MKRINLKLLTIMVLASATMHGQATRTFVSGVGDDQNPCSRTAPCKTFAGAISKTAAGGEIDALDPGGFGAVTITKAITIDGGGGQVASVLVAGVNGITVAAGPGDSVKLRNLRIDGIGLGLNGIEFISGHDLHVENCVIFNFTQNGIDISPSADAMAQVVHTVINGVGQVGIRAANSSGTTQLNISNSEVTTSNIGIEAADHSKVVISHSLVDGATAAGVQADTSSADATVFINNSDLNFNGIGIQSGPGKAEVTVAESGLAFNGKKFARNGGEIFVEHIETPHEQ